MEYPNEVRIPFLNDISRRYRILACDNNPEAGNGRHHYLVTGFDENGVVDFEMQIDFQKGPLPQTGHNGILSNIFLQVLIDHLQSFQTGDYANRQTALAITNLEQAYHWLADRSDDRAVRGVLGAHKK